MGDELNWRDTRGVLPVDAKAQREAAEFIKDLKKSVEREYWAALAMLREVMG